MRTPKSILFLILLSSLLAISLTAKADYEPQIHVNIPLERARTYDSVLVMVFSDPLPYGNNSTIASNNIVQLTFTNLGTAEVIHAQNLTLRAGVANWEFKVDPNWGEFTGVVKVIDEEINSETTAKVEVVYSTDWIIAMQNKHDSEERELDRISNIKVAETNSNTVKMTIGGLFVFTFITLIRLQHTRARKNNQDSLWDRFLDRVWPYDESNSRETMYLTDPNYSFPAHGRKSFEAESIFEEYLQAEEDEALIAYEQSQRRERLRKIDPKLVREVTDPNVSLEDLRKELDKVPEDLKPET
jgi:hypothetical protein